ncbi:P-loop containing nucleoside triphosphate hydrolase protein [Hypoxylon crocopeplum]|nr:P-loop containing nucleoside triphosphate hydrolase protein [Hypoxylon crocopeplum]
MGQTFSKSGTRLGDPNVLNDRTEAPVQEVIPSLSVPATTDSSQAHSPPQNQARVDDQASHPSPKQRQYSYTAASSNGYYTSTAAEQEDSPSSYKHNWNRGHPLINSPNDQPFLPEDEFIESMCSIHSGQAFRRHLKKPSLEIICPDLNAFLRNITDLSTTCQGDGRLPPFSVNEPYELFFHNRKKILQEGREDTNEHIREHVLALFNFIQKKSPLAWEKLDEIEGRRCYEIAFKDLWLLYPPGETVFNRDDGAWRAYKVDRVEIYSGSNSETMSIHCWFLDFDKTGKWLVPQVKVFCVPSYSSERPIRNLDVIPHWCCGGLGEKLIERGKIYWSYRGDVFHKRYDGDAWLRTSQEDPVNVIIDYVTSSKYQQDTGLDEPHCTGIVCSICQGKVVQLQSYPTDAPHDSDICEARQTESCTYNPNSLMFCPPRLWAFSLRHKSWKMIPPQEFSEIQSQAESFEKLQMDEDKKKDLEFVLCGHLENRQACSSPDLIKGKGQGLNVLLHGNPGTGKTLTVESLCEKHRIPLYALTCGELGNSTDSFEDRLQRAFLRAANWGAILLLEEADILVRNRDYDLQRCAIMSSFLSKLEYSRAVVFMTTNRVTLFDVALKSQVHITLTFPDLDLRAQKEIWKDVIHRLQGVNARDKEALKYWVRSELDNLDERRYVKMNGRQIRNCINAASAMARGIRNDGSPKDLDVKKVLRLGADFIEYVCKGDKADIHVMMQDRARKKELAQQV